MSDEIESKERHTPGPWVGAYVKNQMCIEVRSKSGELICESYQWHRNESHLESSIARMKADARLIAAAPDLLAALQGLLADDYRNATAALATHGDTEADGALVAEREAAARAAISQATEAKGPA